MYAPLGGADVVAMQFSSGSKSHLERANFNKTEYTRFTATRNLAHPKIISGESVLQHTFSTMGYAIGCTVKLNSEALTHIKVEF